MVSITRKTPTGAFHEFTVSEKYFAALYGYSLELFTNSLRAAEYAQEPSSPRTVTIEEERFATISGYDMFEDQALRIGKTAEEVQSYDNNPEHLTKVTIRASFTGTQSVAPVTVKATFKVPVYKVTYLYDTDFEKMTPEEQDRYLEAKREREESDARWAAEDAKRKAEQQRQIEEAARALISTRPETFGVITVPDPELLETRAQIAESEEVDASLPV